MLFSSLRSFLLLKKKCWNLFYLEKKMRGGKKKAKDKTTPKAFAAPAWLVSMASSFWPPNLLSQQLPNFETQWHISLRDWLQLLHICSWLACLTLPLFVSVAVCPGSRVTLLFLTSLHTCPHYDFNHISGTEPLPAHGFRSALSSKARCPEHHSRLMDTAWCAHTHIPCVPYLEVQWFPLGHFYLRYSWRHLKLSLAPDWTYLLFKFGALPVSLTTVCWWVLKVPPHRHPLTPGIYPFLSPTVTWWATLTILPPVMWFLRLKTTLATFCCGSMVCDRIADHRNNPLERLEYLGIKMLPFLVLSTFKKIIQPC